MGDFDCCADGDHDTAPYTPDTPAVKAAYTRAMRDTFVASASEHDAEFDRWLEQTIRAARLSIEGDE